MVPTFPDQCANYPGSGRGTNDATSAANRYRRKVERPVRDDLAARATMPRVGWTGDGLFRDEQLASLVHQLTTDVAAVVRFAFITGWRIGSEVLPLRWSHVDFSPAKSGWILARRRVDEGRTFPFTDASLSELGRICPFVFNPTRPADQELPGALGVSLHEGRRAPSDSA